MSNQDTVSKMLKAANEAAMKATAEERANKSFLDRSSKPSLEGLVYALRHPETWPEGFVWNYRDCNSCAMGLARQLWDSVPRTVRGTGASKMARTFAMPYEVANSIFMGKGPTAMDWLPFKTENRGMLWWKEQFQVADHSRVTPEMVADQIEKYLADRE